MVVDQRNVGSNHQVANKGCSHQPVANFGLGALLPVPRLARVTGSTVLKMVGGP